MNALCRAVEHKAVCLCPDDYQGDPTDRYVNPFQGIGKILTIFFTFSSVDVVGGFLFFLFRVNTP